MPFIVHNLQSFLFFRKWISVKLVFQKTYKVTGRFYIKITSISVLSIPIVKIRQSHNLLIFVMGITVPRKGHHIDDLVQDCSNSSALAMELLQSCNKPSILNSPIHFQPCFTSSLFLCPSSPCGDLHMGSMFDWSNLQYCFTSSLFLCPSSPCGDLHMGSICMTFPMLIT